MAHYHLILHNLWHKGENHWLILKYGHFSNHYAEKIKVYHANLHFEHFVSSVMLLQHHHVAVIKLKLCIMHHSLCIVSDIYYEQTDGHQEL